MFRQPPFTDFGYHRVTYDTAKFYMLDAVIGKILADRIEQSFSFYTFASVTHIRGCSGNHITLLKKSSSKLKKILPLPTFPAPYKVTC
ncbi:hypothetical protein YA49_22920 [Enterobacter cloacae subsp. cloacae]|nr:hypothetical protein YA49_22920 [Enterobacter cloacae subsp. cloacae]